MPEQLRGFGLIREAHKPGGTGAERNALFMQEAPLWPVLRDFGPPPRAHHRYRNLATTARAAGMRTLTGLEEGKGEHGDDAEDGQGISLPPSWVCEIGEGRGLQNKASMNTVCRHSTCPSLPDRRKRSPPSVSRPCDRGLALGLHRERGTMSESAS